MTTTRDPLTWKPLGTTAAPPPIIPTKVYYEAWKWGTAAPRIFKKAAMNDLVEKQNTDISILDELTMKYTESHSCTRTINETVEIEQKYVKSGICCGGVAYSRSSGGSCCGKKLFYPRKQLWTVFNYIMKL